MAQMTSILVKDDAATPVEHALYPVSDNPHPQWRETAYGVPVDGQIRYSLNIERTKNRAYKVTAKLEVPVMETLGASGSSAGYVAPPKVAYVNTGIVTMFCDPRSTEQDRANVLRMLTGILQGAGDVTGTGTLTNTSAGQAFLTNYKPTPTAFRSLMLPN